MSNWNKGFFLTFITFCSFRLCVLVCTHKFQKKIQVYCSDFFFIYKYLFVKNSIKNCQSSSFASHRFANLNALCMLLFSLIYTSKSGANDRYGFESAAKSYSISFSCGDNSNWIVIFSNTSILGAGLSPFSIFERYSAEMPICREKFLREICFWIRFLFINIPQSLFVFI